MAPLFLSGEGVEGPHAGNHGIPQREILLTESVVVIKVFNVSLFSVYNMYSSRGISICVSAKYTHEFAGIRC